MAANDSSFSLAVSEWAKAAKGKVDANVRAITLSLFRGIILATPVDTGRARGNWQTSVGAPIEGQNGRIDPSGGQAISEVVSNMGGAGSITWLSNNVPYILVLEYGGYPNPPKRGTRVKGARYEVRSEGGYSRQAPAGFVRINMGRVRDIVRESVATTK